MAKSSGLLFLALLIAGCTSSTPLPTPLTGPQHLATTPAFEPWVSRKLAQFMQVEGSTGFNLEVIPPEEALKATRRGRVSLMITSMHPPPGWFATPLGREAIAVIVHPGNPVRGFTIPILAQLFAGQIASWSEIGGADLMVQPVIPLEGDEVRLQFEALVMKGAAATPNALLAPSPAAMLDMVRENPGAIGYLPWSQMNEQGGMAQVEASFPTQSTISQGSYPLTLPVIAIAPQEPGGALRSWLGWVQASQSDQD